MSLPAGIDISKEKLDIYIGGSFAQIKNNAQAIKAFFKKEAKDSQIVMEATGKYHRLAHQLLEEMGFQVMIVNPYQSKNFAKAMNLLCKTDKVDAKMLSQFAERMDFKPTLCLKEDQQKMLDLSRHLDDLKKLKVELEGRKRESKGFIDKSLESTVDVVKEQIKKTKEELDAVIQDNESLQENVALLMSIPGVGLSTATSLLSYLRELGTANKREIAALSGLAPMNNESGTFKGKRRIRGGRQDVRSHLYMPVLGAATQYNKRLNVFYEKLVQSGKPKKVALTACMRKLLVWANCIIASGQPWNANHEEKGLTA